jgi:hypothetical protein
MEPASFMYMDDHYYCAGSEIQWEYFLRIVEEKEDNRVVCIMNVYSFNDGSLGIAEGTFEGVLDKEKNTLKAFINGEVRECVYLPKRDV